VLYDDLLVFERRGDAVSKGAGERGGGGREEQRNGSGSGMLLRMNLSGEAGLIGDFGLRMLTSIGVVIRDSSSSLMRSCRRVTWRVWGLVEPQKYLQTEKAFRFCV